MQNWIIIIIFFFPILGISSRKVKSKDKNFLWGYLLHFLLKKKKTQTIKEWVKHHCRQTFLIAVEILTFCNDSDFYPSRTSQNLKLQLLFTFLVICTHCFLSLTDCIDIFPFFSASSELYNVFCRTCRSYKNVT